MKFIKTVKTDAGDEIELQRETDAAVEQNQLISQGWEVVDDANASCAAHLQQVTNRQTNKEIKHV